MPRALLHAMIGGLVLRLLHDPAAEAQAVAALDRLLESAGRGGLHGTVPRDG